MGERKKAIQAGPKPSIECQSLTHLEEEDEDEDERLVAVLVHRARRHQRDDQRRQSRCGHKGGDENH